MNAQNITTQQQAALYSYLTVISFTMAAYGLEFVKALEKLADEVMG